jgi:hypothetical protein
VTYVIWGFRKKKAGGLRGAAAPPSPEKKTISKFIKLLCTAVDL